MIAAFFWIGVYLFGAGCASALRAFYIEKPGDWTGEDSWKMGNVILPMIWPVYLPILGGYVIGSVAKRVHSLLNEKDEIQ